MCNSKEKFIYSFSTTHRKNSSIIAFWMSSKLSYTVLIVPEMEVDWVGSDGWLPNTDKMSLCSSSFSFKLLYQQYPRGIKSPPNAITPSPIDTDPCPLFLASWMMINMRPISTIIVPMTISATHALLEYLGLSMGLKYGTFSLGMLTWQASSLAITVAPPVVSIVACLPWPILGIQLMFFRNWSWKKCTNQLNATVCTVETFTVLFYCCEVFVTALTTKKYIFTL